MPKHVVLAFKIGWQVGRLNEDGTLAEVVPGGADLMPLPSTEAVLREFEAFQAARARIEAAAE